MTQPDQNDESNSLPPFHPGATASQLSGSHEGILPQWLRHLCSSRRILWIAPILGLILAFPSLFTGFFFDDYILGQQSIEQSVFPKRAVWDYYNWVETDSETAAFRERGIIAAWWTPNELRFRFFRPLTSLLHALQFNLIRNMPWLQHLGLVVLYGILILLSGKLQHLFSSSALAVGVGLLLFAVDDAHALAVGWISSYNTVLCCLFGYGAFLIHERWRTSKSVRFLLLFIIFYSLSLLSSEGGIALMGYLIAYALFRESGELSKKLQSLLPSVIISSVYVVFYMQNNFGVRHHTIYLSLLDSPIETIITIANNTMTLLASQLFLFSPVSIMVQMSFLSGAFFSLLLLVGIVILFHHKFFVNSRVAFYATGMVLSAMPFTLGSPPFDRLLLWAGLGAAGLLGELLTNIKAYHRPQRIAAKTLLFINIFISTLLFIPSQLVYPLMFKAYAVSPESRFPEKNTVVFNAPNDMAFTYSPAIRSFTTDRKWPNHLYYLYCGMDTLSLSRTGEKTFIATVKNGWFSGAYERRRRSDRLHFSVGDSIHCERMQARLLEVTKDGRPQSVEFSFTDSILSYAWLYWGKAGLSDCSLPPVGSTIKLSTTIK